MWIRRLSFAPLAVALAACAWPQSVVTFLHTNDMHAHAEATKVKGVAVGGYSRQATLILRLKEGEANPVLLNAGDTFQGTLYFNVYEGLADLQFMNLVGYQAMAVGNHEFDRGAATLGTFARNARFPLLAANLDVSAEPALAGLVLPSTVVMAGTEKLGVVGAITPDVTNISSPGPNVKTKDLVSSVQAEVDKFHKEGIRKVVLLSHLGYGEDKEIATQVKGLDVIVGGHSHTLLGDPGVKDVTGQGAYPTVVKSGGRTVLVVQAWEWGKAVGRLKVEFDAKDEVKAWSGAPVAVTADIAENPTITSLYAALNKPISQLRSTEVGSSTDPLDRERTSDGGDSTMGNVIADAMLVATKSYGAEVAFTNAGGVRSGVGKGVVTYGNLIEVTPFGNTLVVLEMTGSEIVGALETGAAGPGMLYPSRGSSYTYDPAAAQGSRVSAVQVAGKPLEQSRTYKVALNSFVAGGGDKHAVVAACKGARTDTGLVDLDALIAYFKSNSPVAMKPEGRVRRR